MRSRRSVIKTSAAVAAGLALPTARAETWWQRLFGIKPEPPPAPPAPPPPAPPPRPAPSPAPSPQLQSELLFGQTAVLSGVLGQPVRGFNAGAQLAFEEQNSRGGVFGRPLRLISLDDKLQPDTAVANTLTLLKEHKVFGLFGCAGSATTLATEPLLRESGAPSFGGYAVTDSVRLRCRGAAYFMRAGYGREAQALVRHLMTIGVTRVGVAYLDNPGGEEVLKLIRAALGQHKVEPAIAAAVALDGANLADAAAKIGGLQPQALIMFLGGSLAASLMKQLGERHLPINYYALSVASSAHAIQQLGERARGLTLTEVVPHPWSQAEPVTLDYRRLAESAQVPVGYFSFEGYLAARVLIEALRRSGPEPSRPKLHATLAKLKMNIAGLELDYTIDGHTGSRFVDLVQIGEAGRIIR